MTRAATQGRGTWNRRQFLGTAGASLAATFLACKQGGEWPFDFLQPLDVGNPLAGYPNRGWERTYRRMVAFDSSFTFLCAPNDTHNCLLRADVVENVIARIRPTYGYGGARDLDAPRASARWDPRCCQKGLALARRFYGDRRVKYPMVRTGFRRWVNAGFPRDPLTGAPSAEFLQRGRDRFERVSWDELYDLTARALLDIARTYSGEAGSERMVRQGYDPAMVAATNRAGVQTIKLRGGMPLLGLTRIFGHYRFANGLALLDAQVRGVGPDQARGARGWDNYSWHTDLPPGHPMVTGQQTVDWDLSAVEHSRLVLVWGMNWITTKMPDAHWLTEARLKGTKVVVIAAEYSATASKGDEVIIVRPGTTPALALGLAHVLLREELYDADYVRRYSDLPALVRMDTLARLTPDQVAGLEAPGASGVEFLGEGQAPPPPSQQRGLYARAGMRDLLGGFVVWDGARGAPAAVARTEVGRAFDARGLAPALQGTFRVRLRDGAEVEARPVFDLVREYLLANFEPQTVEEITWAPAEAVRSLARQIAANPERTLFAMGMGPNQFFNNDLKDRAVFLVAALTRNVGFVGGNVGSYAGNYRAAYFNGIPGYVAENPFDLQLRARGTPRIRPYLQFESAHYFNHGDRVLRQGGTLLTGRSHVPTPTKAIWVANSNSLIGNAKGHYETVFNLLPRVELVAVNEWWWTASCEYADVVFPVDSWAEFKLPDATASVTNPFITIFPRTPLRRIHDTRSDLECTAGVAARLGELIDDRRLRELFAFVHRGRAQVYLQRIFDASNMGRGYDVEALERAAQEGRPAVILSRTYPKVGGWEQGNEDRPWYTRTGRLEFYRDEPEFLDSGENLPVYREPIDATFYEPNVIVGRPHPALRPKPPERYGVPRGALDGETRQARHVLKPWAELRRTSHPLASRGYRFVFHTPKHRHGAHTTPVDTDLLAVWFGPFGDLMRHDWRAPFVGEGYVDINPADARDLGIEDGDYVWVDADPADRPFHGHEERPGEARVARLLCRARYYPGTPRSITRMWHNMFGATIGSVEGHESHPTGLAKNPRTGYQAMFRYGSHQSCTRSWLKPTQMSDSLVRKDTHGQRLGVGFEPDVHCPTGAPREAMVRITRAEPGGLGGVGLWRPARLRYRPGYESAALRRYIEGDYIRARG